jgi:hypothetical protein
MTQTHGKFHHRFQRGFVCFTFVLGLVSASSPALTQSPPVSTGEVVKVIGKFTVVEMKKSKQRGVSGIACLATAANRRLCLAVNDEERFAEWAIFDEVALTPTGKTAQLLTNAKTQKDAIVGVMPGNQCKQDDDFEEFDGEAIAVSGGKIYTVGSHACSRSKDKFRPSAFVLARLDATGEAVGTHNVQRTWRVSDIILNSPLKDSFARPGANGTNIEGMAIANGRIYFGFRTPVVDNKATILSTEVEPLFVAGAEKATAMPDAIPLPLGAGVGIRDLAALPDGRLLVLSGPATTDKVPYLLHWLDPSTGALKTLAELRTDRPGKNDDGNYETAKAEAIAVLAADATSVTLLVTYDNIDDGEPRIHRISLSKEQDFDAPQTASPTTEPSRRTTCHIHRPTIS